MICPTGTRSRSFPCSWIERTVGPKWFQNFDILPLEVGVSSIVDGKTLRTLLEIMCFIDQWRGLRQHSIGETKKH